MSVAASVTPPAELENCAEVTAAGWESYTGNNKACDSRQVTENKADLSIDGWVSPGDPAPGQEYIYRIYYNNNQPAGSRNVHIIDTLPDGVTFVSQWNPGGWTVDTSQPGKITWETDYLPGWSGRYLELRLRVNSGATPGTTQLHNRVEITGDAPMPTPPTTPGRTTPACRSHTAISLWIRATRTASPWPATSIRRGSTSKATATCLRRARC